MPARRPGFKHMAMRWQEPTYLHLPLDAGFDPPLPPGLSLDRFDRTPWIGVACFRVARMRPFGVPMPPPWSSVPWVNVRTYVEGPEGPGVWFLSMHIPSRGIAMGARLGSHQPAQRSAVKVNFHVNRRTCSVAPGRSTSDFSLEVACPPMAGPTSDFERFFAGRPIEYVADRGRVAVIDTWHEPMVTASTSDFLVRGSSALDRHLDQCRDAEAICHVSPGVDVRMGFPRRLGATDTASGV